jgi:hypothetical protein
MLPTRRSSVLRSMVNSSSRPSSMTATRVSRASALMMISLWTTAFGRTSCWTFWTIFSAVSLMRSMMPLGASWNFTGAYGWSAGADSAAAGASPDSGAGSGSGPAGGSPAATFSARSISFL